MAAAIADDKGRNIDIKYIWWDLMTLMCPANLSSDFYDGKGAIATVDR